jgi:4-hydroxy-tetrahydrodipicolinate reductase
VSTHRLAIIGDGKMGDAVAQLAAQRGWSVVARIGRDGNEDGRGITAASLAGAEAAIEFTEPSVAALNAAACLDAGCPVVVGTTGWYDGLPALTERARRLGGALFWAPNFSLGVYIFVETARETARRLAPLATFDAHLVETHHASKKDAPSGTAKAIARAVSDALGHELPTTSVRIGSVPGTHELTFDAPFEQIRLVHEARDRRVFAEGALVAARWLLGKQGVFTMRDMLAASQEPGQ